MGEKKSNSDNGKRQNKKSVQIMSIMKKKHIDINKKILMNKIII